MLTEESLLRVRVHGHPLRDLHPIRQQRRRPATSQSTLNPAWTPEQLGKTSQGSDSGRHARSGLRVPLAVGVGGDVKIAPARVVLVHGTRGSGRALMSVAGGGGIEGVLRHAGQL